MHQIEKILKDICVWMKLDIGNNDMETAENTKVPNTWFQKPFSTQTYSDPRFDIVVQGFISSVPSNLMGKSY